MLEAPGRDSEPSRENFEKAVVMMAASIIEWINQHSLGPEESAKIDETNNKEKLLSPAIDHLCQYGIMGARTSGFVALTVANLWSQSQYRVGKYKKENLKEQMLWVMQSPPVEAAILETFKPLDEEGKKDAQNFARGSEAIITTFVNCALEKFSSRFSTESNNFVENHRSELGKLQEFFHAIDEGGLSYLAKVLELTLITTMNSALFNCELSAEHSFYYDSTIEFLVEIFEIENTQE
ncbi:MAG: hypothetical protein VX481_06490 [Cyanobacteriota bacterium]|nr:hypothetical protein [Cyanobacteriota bacterium]